MGDGGDSEQCLKEATNAEGVLDAQLYRDLMRMDQALRLSNVLKFSLWVVFLYLPLAVILGLYCFTNFWEACPMFADAKRVVYSHRRIQEHTRTAEGL